MQCNVGLSETSPCPLAPGCQDIQIITVSQTLQCTALCCTVLYCIVHYNALYCAVQHSIVQCCTIHRNAFHYIVIASHRTILYKTLHHITEYCLLTLPLLTLLHHITEYCLLTLPSSRPYLRATADHCNIMHSS